jgi:outer membrane protein
MSKIKSAALAAALIVGATVSASAQGQPATQAGIAAAAVPDGKVVVLNTSLFPQQIGELKQKYDQVDNQFKDRFQKLQGLEQQLKQLQSEIENKGNLMGADKLREMQINYDELKKRGGRDYEDFKADVDKALDSATKPVRDKLSQFLQNYAQQRGIVLILNLQGVAQTGALAYFNPSTDVTQDFITEYNKANPVAGVSTGPAPAGATSPKPGPTKPPGSKNQ